MYHLTQVDVPGSLSTGNFASASGNFALAPKLPSSQFPRFHQTADVQPAPPPRSRATITASSSGGLPPPPSPSSQFPRCHQTADEPPPPPPRTASRAPASFGRFEDCEIQCSSGDRVHDVPPSLQLCSELIGDISALSVCAQAHGWTRPGSQRWRCMNCSGTAGIAKVRSAKPEEYNIPNFII